MTQNLENIIKIKDEKIKAFNINLAKDHIFISILENSAIFKTVEEKITGMLIFNACQDCLRAVRFDNFSLVELYSDKIGRYLKKIAGPEALTGIGAIANPMYSYYYYRKGEYKLATDKMAETLINLKDLSGYLKEDAVPALLEQYKNSILIHLRFGYFDSAMSVLQSVLDEKEAGGLLLTLGKNCPQKLHFQVNNFLDTIMLKVYAEHAGSYATFLKTLINLLKNSVFYSNEKSLIERYIARALTIEDYSQIISSNLPPVIEGTFVNSVNEADECYDLIKNYFITTHNISI